MYDPGKRLVEGVIMYRGELKVYRDLFVFECDFRELVCNTLLDVPETVC